MDKAITTNSPLLALSGVVKTFPHSIANDHIDLDIRAGEIHALLGENGAGKSTLVKIIYGVLKPDAGEIRWQGRVIAIDNPAYARDLGIAMVFQHFSLFESLSVEENIALGLNDKKEREQLSQAISEIKNRYGLEIDLHRIVLDLSVGERQRIEIVRALLQKPKLLIMDEPTSVLTPQEAIELFSVLRRLAEEGCAILYISHKLEEIRELCSKATILRHGRVVATCNPAQETARRLAEWMIGAELKALRHAKRPAPGNPVRFAVRRLSIQSEQPFGMDLKEISFEVQGGEIFGIAGIAGNGQTELMAALSGEILSPEKGSILIDGTEAGWMGPKERRALGGCFVPEERIGHASISGMTLAENAFLSGHVRQALVALGLIRKKRTIDFASEILKAFDVRALGPKAEARSLSGGNLQKFILGREILQVPSVLVISQPTWGLDAGATASIHQALIDLAEKGTALIVISQDIDEIFALSDRIAVIAAGELSTPLPSTEASVEKIGLLMGGAHKGEGKDYRDGV